MPPAACTVSAISRMSLSKSPAVFGFVSMKQAVLSETAARSSARSTQPSFEGISRVVNPAIAAEAGLVPCAVSGSSTSVRCPRIPRSRK